MEEFHNVEVCAACVNSHLNSAAMVVLIWLEQHNIKRLQKVACMGWNCQ
jgi:hypothetical protein